MVWSQWTRDGLQDHFGQGVALFWVRTGIHHTGLQEDTPCALGEGSHQQEKLCQQEV
jgi:hypothetical protein